jgi:hypothetical protein
LRDAFVDQNCRRHVSQNSNAVAEVRRITDWGTARAPIDQPNRLQSEHAKETGFGRWLDWIAYALADDSQSFAMTLRL